MMWESIGFFAQQIMHMPIDMHIIIFIIVLL